MKSNKFVEGFRKLKADLSSMTFSEKVEHIWTYYKEYMLVAGVILLLLVGVFSSLINVSKQTLLSGVAVNVSLTPQGYDYLSTDYFAKLEGNPKKEHVDFSYVHFGDLGDAQNVQVNYNAAMSVIAMAAAKTLDYMIMDEMAMEYYINQDVFMDLRQFFTEEEQAQWAQSVIYAEPEGSEEMYPVAIIITQLPFSQDCIGADGPVYLAFAGNTPRREALRGFWEYLLSWEGNL